ncbi:hypothetical protein G7054_g11143 [Neopestalotiopsis clavispora]|nr:hypothetical protein G7054_g11143 [Neopestalotiopsis clavispora]
MDPTNNESALVDFDKFDFYDAVFYVRQQVYLHIDETQWVDSLCHIAHTLSWKLGVEEGGYPRIIYFQILFVDSLWEHLLSDQASLSPWRASLCHLRQQGRQYDGTQDYIKPSDLIWIGRERAIGRLVDEQDFFEVLHSKVFSREQSSRANVHAPMEHHMFGPSFAVADGIAEQKRSLKRSLDESN